MDVGTRSWIETNGKPFISAFILGFQYTGYNLIHGRVISALIDEVCTEYCEIWVDDGGQKVVPVIKAKVLFVLCERLPMLLSSGEAGRSAEELLRPDGDESDVAPASLPRSRHIFWSLILIASIFVGIIVYI